VGLHSDAASRLERANCNSFTLSYAWGYTLDAAPPSYFLTSSIVEDPRASVSLATFGLVVHLSGGDTCTPSLWSAIWNDDRDRGKRASQVFGDAVLIRRHAAVRHGGHHISTFELRGRVAGTPPCPPDVVALEV